MYTIKETNIIVNYAALIKSGLDIMMATFIAKELSCFKVNTVAISDDGVHVEIQDVVTRNEKKMVFKFIA